MRDVYKDPEMLATVEKKEPVENLFHFRRIEKKYLINSNMAEILRSQIGYYIPKDQRSMQMPLISSVYFDNSSWKCYNEQLARVNPRFKVRLRQYENVDVTSTRAFLEIKRKAGQVSLKDRVRINMHASGSGTGYSSTLRTPVTDIMLNAEIKNDVYYKITDALKAYQLEPVVKVNYFREAYENSERSLRVTFDSNLEFHSIRNYHTDFIISEFRMPDDFFVMEIKYSGKMPTWLSMMLQTNKLSNTRFSKYCMSVKNLYKTEAVAQSMLTSISANKDKIKEYGNTKEFIYTTNAV